MAYSSQKQWPATILVICFVVAGFFLASAGRVVADEPSWHNVSPGDNEADDGAMEPLPYLPEQLVVKMKPGLSAASIAGGGMLLAVKAQLLHNDVYLFQLAPSVNPVTAAAEMSALAGVEYAQPNYILEAVHPVQASYPFSDLQAIGDYEGQPAAAALGLSVVHLYGRGAGVTVGVIDGGVDYDHPELAGHVASGYDYVDLDADAFDEPGGFASGHGTFVAGVVHLVAPQTQIKAYRVMDPRGRGDGFSMARAIERAVDDGCKVINISLVLTHRHLAVDDALEYAKANGVIVAAAAGNAGVEMKTYPAAEAAALAVAALDSNSVRAKFSEYGTHVDLCAPGTRIYSCYQDDLYAWWSGTSFAAPFVSGLAAVLESVQPAAAATQVISAMRTTAADIDGANPSLVGKLGDGLIDPLAALVALDTLETATATPDTIRIEFPEAFFPLVMPRDSVWLTSTNAPANYTVDVGADSLAFLVPIDTMGTTDDWAGFYISPIGIAGVYVNTLEYTVEGTVAPAVVTVIQTVIAADSVPHAWTTPTSFYFKAKLGEEVLYGGTMYLQSSNAPANWSANVYSSTTQLTTLIDSSGVTDDSVSFQVDPSLATSAGFYTDSIVFTVDSVEYPWLVPVFVEITDTVPASDTAWVVPDTGLALEAIDLDTLWACVSIFSTNAPANYFVEVAGTPTFVSLVDSVGTTPDSVCFVANAALPDGVYADTLLFYVDGVTNNPIPAVIRLTVGTPGGGDTTGACPAVWLDNVSTPPGGEVEVTVRNGAVGPTWGGFDFLLDYDDTRLTFTGAAAGDFLTGCGWEYFQAIDDSSSPGRVRIVGIADIGAVSGHPSCLTPDSNAILARLTFQATDDSVSGCGAAAVRFWWNDCGDNSISNTTGDSLWIAGVDPWSVVDWDGSDLTGVPRIGGPPRPCGSGALSCTEFRDGVVQITCDTVIVPGDSAAVIPSSLLFTAPYGSTTTQESQVVVYSSNAPATYVAWVLDSPNFVTIPDSVGVTNDSMRVVVDPSGLGTGLHVDTVVIDVAGIASSLTLRVQLHIEADTVAPPAPAIWLDLNAAAKGDSLELAIRSGSGGLPWGGFDFLVSYDASALTYVDAVPGAFVLNCGWEYFEPNVVSLDPGLIRVVGLADLAAVAGSPSCLTPDSTDVLASLQFEVRSDSALACQTTPVRFWWDDCGDNAISSPDGTTLWIASAEPGAVRDYDGSDITGTPNTGGPSPGCAWFKAPMDQITFRNGGVAVACDSIVIDSVRVSGIEIYPNPFNPRTEIAFVLGTPTDVRLDIFNVLGQRVVTLVDEQLGAGRHKVLWDGRDRDGRNAASGVYFSRLQAGSEVVTRKLLLLR